jgi:hypothetical protein
MFSNDASHFVFVLATGMVMMGVISIGAGIILLITRASGRAIQTIAAQATRLAQKGLAEEISGLVGNASALLDSLNQLVRTSAGIGVFLVVFGFVMLVAAFMMVKYL